MQAGDVYEEFAFRVTDDRFIFEPFRFDDQVRLGNECLMIDRLSHEITIEAAPAIPIDATAKQIFGIFGIIRLIAGPYLIVITKRELVGTINRRNVYRVTGKEIHPFAKTMLHLSEKQVVDNRILLSMVETVLDFKSYYFATDFDITHSLQRLANTPPEFLQMPMHARADQRFVWNRFMIRDLAALPEAHRFTLPILLGFVEIRQCSVAGHVFQLALISRRSRLRAGVRFQTRGIDIEGNAANFIETEQVLEYAEFMCSFVQTRGSIPLLWSQKPNLRLNPWPKVRLDDQLHGFMSHIQQQTQLYGAQILVSLVNTHGRERGVGSQLRILMLNNPPQGARLVEFDFHKEGYLRLAHLVSNVLAEDANNFGYFTTQRDNPRLITQQVGVFRTNCIDCLDRTNVVQSLLARRVLENQLRFLQVLVNDDALSRYDGFEQMYKNLWADNGDSCSLQYAGTHALKGDFTRTGKRTKFGALNDGVNAVTRWYINNFYDGFRQDAIDLCLGNVEINEAMANRVIFAKPWGFKALVVLCLVGSLGMLIMTALMRPEHSNLVCLFWFALAFGLVSFIWVNGEDFCNKPVLKQE